MYLKCREAVTVVLASGVEEAMFCHSVAGDAVSAMNINVIKP